MSNCGSNSCGDYIKELIERKKEYLAFESDEKLTWCGGCGNYGIRNAMQRALTMSGFGLRNTMFYYDIGCNGNASDKTSAFSFHGLHGRVLPLAAGGALANLKIKTIASAGDGATMSEGVNHLVHAVRSNYPMVFLLHNNQNYGLTTGQGSATTKKGYAMNGSPDGVMLEPMNPSEFIMTLNPSFVARTFSGDVRHMTEIFKRALQHDGFAFIEILQSCPTYNKATPNVWFWDRIYDVSTVEGYDVSNIEMAKKAVADIYEKIAVGLIYHDKDAVSFDKKMSQRAGVASELSEEVKHYPIDKFLDKLR